MASEAARILIVAARYYRDIVEELEAGAREALEAAGAVVDVAEAPGAFEIPAIIAMHRVHDARFSAWRPPVYDGYVALGCVIRGETTHYDYVCGECARGLMSLSIDGGTPIGFGVLTVENAEQAWARARRSEKNKGAEAAKACLAMVALHKRLADAKP